MQRAPVVPGRLASVAVFVLVGGWPGSGKSTLARALAPELRLPLLAKDEIEEALSDGLGRPQTVEESQRLGRVALLTPLWVAQRCPGAVLDSTRFDYTRPLLAALPGAFIDVRCILPLELARSRCCGRAATRHPGHLDTARTFDESWGGRCRRSAWAHTTAGGGHFRLGRRARPV